tara:strand:+ start:842 stop:1222 length:381 start_codon:yes stop_codon:yes gene_type:complete
MKRSVIVVPLLAVFFSACAFADDKSHEPMKDAKMMKDGNHMADGKPMPMTQAAGDMTEGEIKRISKGSRKLTIKHGEIKNLDMPPMTMTFTASNDKMLEMVKKGDMVKFKVEAVNGQMVITEIMPQ